MIGETISHYKILEKIGAGGMGIVYKAEDTKLKRTVALKFLPPELTRDKEAKKRFLHEAQAASALDHPNICNIHEIDETGDGQIFMAMAFYEGQTLKEKINTGPLPVEEATNIAIQIADGLDKAHKKEIIHRDIKSANIIVTSDEVVKILDFGLAKLRGQTKLTQEGTTLGTVAYMSPEQVTGEKADQRSDIWSLGVILYEMITGQTPFKGEYEQSIMYSIMNEEPEPVTGLRTGIPAELERVISKILNKEPSARYQNVVDLIVDLKNITKETGKISKGTAFQSAPAKRHVHKRGLKWLVLVGLAILVTAGFLLLTDKSKSEKTTGSEPPANEKEVSFGWKNSIAVLPFANISPDREQEYFCDGMTEEIITKLTYIKDLKVISRTSVMRFKNSEKTIKEIGRELAVEHVLEGSVRRDKDRVRITAQLIRVADDAHLWAKNYDRKFQDIFSIQDEVSKTIANSLKLTMSPSILNQLKSGETKNMLAYEYYLKGMYFMNSRYLKTLEEEDFQQSVYMLEKAMELDPSYTKAYSGLVWVYTSHLMYTRNQLDLRKIYKLAKRLEVLSPGSARGHFVLGLYHALNRDFDQSFTHLKKAWELSPNDAEISYGIGFFYYRAGLFRKALRFCEKSIDFDPLMPHSYATPILSSIYLQKYRSAESYIKKAAELQKSHPVLLQFQCGLYLRTGNYEKAEEILKKLWVANQNPDSIRGLQMILYALRGKRVEVMALNQTSSQAFSILNLKDEAMAIIQKALRSDTNLNNYLYLINNSHYDNLKDDPRFQKIVADAKVLYVERLRKYGDL